MKKPYVVAALLFFVAFVSGSTFASTEKVDKEEVSIENIKAPPKDVKDILKVFNSAKQDEVELEKAKKVAALPVPNSTDPRVLNGYYYRKSVAEEILGNTKDAIEHAKKVVNDYPSTDPALATDELVHYGVLEALRGNRILSNQIFNKATEKVVPMIRGWYISIDRLIISNCIALGDFECAKSTLRRLESNYTSLSQARNVRAEHRLSWQSSYEWMRGKVFMAEGKHVEAERAIRRSLKVNEELLDNVKSVGKDPLDVEVRSGYDLTINPKNINRQRVNIMGDLAVTQLQQKRLIDAEYWARESIMLGINRFGINSTSTSYALMLLTRVISEQGRQAEAVLLANAALKSAQSSTNYQASTAIANARKILGTVLAADGKYSQADKVFNEMVEGIKSDPEIAKLYRSGDLDWALAQMKTGKVNQAIEMTSEMLGKLEKQIDKNSPRLAMVRAFNAAALQASGQSSQALVGFQQSVPILIDQSKNDSENATSTIRQTQRITFVLEEYLAALALQEKADGSGRAATEAFRIADLARGSGVQRALTASAARATISDPQLAALARQEQDLQQRINTLTELLTGLLSAPPEQQLPAVQSKIRSDIAQFKSQRTDLKKEIERKFPEYAELVDPKPASVERTQKILKADEVLVSWYFTENTGYVWGITKDRPVQFMTLNLGRSQLAKQVLQLRKALDPGVATIEEIPAFDVVLAHQLYQQVLAPVENSLNGKKVMLTVPHGELAQLPMSLLVTKPTAQPVKGGTTAFSGYRTVPWLARDIAISQIPSVTALAALRSLPPGNPSRKNFVGFGDPYFSGEQEKAALKQSKPGQMTTRGIPLSLRNVPKTSGVSSAELALLPRLPDTKQELEEIAQVVGAAPDDVFLHQKASVKQVMTTDLSNRKIVMFATHGLIPGELNGLTQPALAMSSPEVTGDKDDGLLTMDKVISLKLDADWVVLSACNTASGDGAGAEAVSGLGRAFFFAGAKALLVSNWPVDSIASRTLMTDLFKTQQKAQEFSKAELLRQAMLTQIDQGGMKQGATMKYAYAHPLFWAPFVVVGD